MRYSDGHWILRAKDRRLGLRNSSFSSVSSSNKWADISSTRRERLLFTILINEDKSISFVNKRYPNKKLNIGNDNNSGVNITSNSQNSKFYLRKSCMTRA